MTNRFPAYKYIITSFFLSGVSALLLQIAWERQLNCYIGTALPTVALIVATFMIGLAIGVQLAGFLLKSRRSGLALYAVSQLLICVLALASLLFARQIEALLTSISVANLSLLPWAFSLRLTVAVVLLLLPASAMGSCFPFLAQHLRTEAAANEETALLYCLNLLGSASGAILAGFILIPWLGVSKTVAAAAAFNLLALICLAPIYLARLKERNVQAEAMAPTASKNTPEAKSFTLRLIGSPLAIVTISGALSMVLEVFWTRLFMLICGPSTYAFALTISSQLLGFALGGTLLAMWLKRRAGQSEDRRAFEVLAALCLLAGLSIFFSLYLINELPWGVFTVQTLLLKGFPALPDFAFISSRALAALSIMLVPCLCLGGIFPTVLAVCPGVGKADDSHLVVLYLANILGAVFGCVVGGLFLVPLLASIWISAIQLSLYLVAICSLWLAGHSAVKAGWLKGRAAVLALSIFSLFFFLSLPHWDKELMVSGVSFLNPVGERLMTPRQFRNFALGKARTGAPFSNNLFYREGLNSTVSVGTVPSNNIIFLKTDGKMEAALPEDPGLPAPTSDIVTQVLLGNLPVVLCPVPPKSALLIGLGSGVTAGAMLDSSEVKELTIAELEKAVLDAAPLFSLSNSHAQEILRQGDRPSRVTQINLDGRNVLSLLNKRYEVIVSQPGEPWIEGSSHLYTWEFWQLVRKRLAPGGLFCQWIPLYTIDRANLLSLLCTFRSVFPNTLVFRSAGAGEIFLIGFNEPDEGEGNRGLIALNQVDKRIKEKSVSKTLGHIGIHGWPDLLSGVIYAPQSLKKVLNQELGAGSCPLNCDDRPRAEFALPSQAIGHGLVVDNSFDSLFRANPFQFDQVYRDCPAGEGAQTTAMARLAVAYLYGGVAQASPRVACHLIDQARRLGGGLALDAAQALQQGGEAKLLTERLRSALADSKVKSVLPDAAPVLSKWLLLKGHADLARECLTAALKESPAQADCLCAMGNVELKLGKPPAAFSSFQKAIQVNPDLAEAHVGAAIASIQLGEYPGAVGFLKRALQLYPGQFQVRLLLGKTLCALGRADEGLVQIVWASRQEPANAEPNLYVTAYYVAKLQWEAASENLPLLLRKLPKDSRAEYLATKIRTLSPVDENDPEIKKLLSLTSYWQLDN